MCSQATKSEPASPLASAPLMAQSRCPMWLIAALLLLVTIALYWPATQCDFVNYDDQDFVTANPHVQGALNWEGVKWAFGNTQQAAYWAPLMWLSHLLAWQLFGLNPWGHHLINVLLHAANTALVFLVFRRMTQATWRSLLLAALFGWHPLRVESVAWVTERKDVLSTLFWILTLWAYVRYAEVHGLKSKVQSLKSKVHGPWSIFYLLSLCCFALGLMSKQMLVTVPFVMLLLDYWPMRRLQLKTQDSRLKTSLPLLLEKLPFFALAAVASLVTFGVQKHAGTLMPGQNLPLGARGANALVAYCRYLGKLFWPTDLAVFYPHPGHWPMGEVLLAGGLLLGISVLLMVKRRRYPFLLMGWLWFCGTLVPAIGLVQSGAQAMADRFTYVPSLGVLILAIWGAYELTSRWRYHVIALFVTGSAALLICAALTRQQIDYWQNSEALFRHALQVTEDNWVAHNNLGSALEKKGQIDEAIRQYQDALRPAPDYALAHNNLGGALVKKGQIDAAIGQYQEALRLKPNYAEAHYNLGAALLNQGQIDEAIRQYQEALRVKPDYAEAHNNLGAAFLKKGQIDEAISQLQAALRLDPDHAVARNNLGIALVTKGQTDEAIRQFQEALRLQPNYVEARNNLATAFGRKGQTDGAILQYQEALRLKPNDAEIHYKLGTALVGKGQVDEAISQFQQAVRLKPDYANARNNLGLALAMKGQIDEAIHQFQEAIRLKPDYADAYNNLGYRWAERGENLDQARAMLEKAVQLEPKNAAFLDSLGWVLFKLNRAPEALDYLLQAIENSRKPDAALYDHLGDIYAALNQREKAAEAWRQSLSVEPNRQIQKKLGDLSAH
jgi:protein O-mannosyl-transferase